MEGFPLFPQWQNTASDVFNGGYEGHREPFEIYFTKDKVAGESLDYGEISVAKGQGRLSIIWFGILYSYFNLQKELACEGVKEDLIRPLGRDHWELMGRLL